MATVLTDSTNCSEIPTVIHLVASNVNVNGSEVDEEDITTITPVEDVLLEDTNGNTFRVIDSEHFQQSTKYYLINFYNPDDIENFNNIINNDNEDNDSAIIRNANDCKTAAASDCAEQNIMYVSQDLRTIVRGNNLKSESGVCFWLIEFPENMRVVFDFFYF